MIFKNLGSAISVEKIIYNQKTNNLRISRIRRGPFFSMLDNHFHSFYEIYYLVAGERNYFVENTNYHIHAGTLVFIPSNRIHKTYFPPEESAGHERILIEFGESYFSRLATLFPGEKLGELLSRKAPVIPIPEEKQAYVEGLFNHIAQELSQRQPGYETAVAGDMAQLLILILRSRSIDQTLSISPKQQKVREIASYISQNYASDLSLDLLAERFYISKYHLCHLFKEITGFTVVEYINTTRIREGERLLIDTDLKISQISERVGYDSVTHFGRVFKECFGKTPVSYRKSFSEKGTSFQKNYSSSEKRAESEEKISHSIFC